MSNVETPVSFAVSVENDATAVELLVDATGMSAGQIKKAMAKGAVWLERGNRTVRLRRVKRALAPGDTLHFHYNAKVLAAEPQQAVLVADVDGYSVWDKPYGMWSQGSRWGDHCSVTRFAEQALERPVWTVHRLDRAASGLILVAHKKPMAANLAELFRERKIDKQYCAIVRGNASEWSLPKQFQTPIDDRSAHTECVGVQLSTDEKQSKLLLKIHSGRKHQIRRHLADSGYPIVGDRLYGAACQSDPDLQLLAERLSFVCPVRDERVEFQLDSQRLLFDGSN